MPRTQSAVKIENKVSKLGCKKTTVEKQRNALNLEKFIQLETYEFH